MAHLVLWNSRLGATWTVPSERWTARTSVGDLERAPLGLKRTSLVRRAVAHLVGATGPGRHPAEGEIDPIRLDARDPHPRVEGHHRGLLPQEGATPGPHRHVEDPTPGPPPQGDAIPGLAAGAQKSRQRGTTDQFATAVCPFINKANNYSRN